MLMLSRDQMLLEVADPTIASDRVEFYIKNYLDLSVRAILINNPNITVTQAISLIDTYHGYFPHKNPSWPLWLLSNPDLYYQIFKKLFDHRMYFSAAFGKMPFHFQKVLIEVLKGNFDLSILDLISLYKKARGREKQLLLHNLFMWSKTILYPKIRSSTFLEQMTQRKFGAIKLLDQLHKEIDDIPTGKGTSSLAKIKTNIHKFYSEFIKFNPECSNVNALCPDYLREEFEI